MMIKRVEKQIQGKEKRVSAATQVVVFSRRHRWRHRRRDRKGCWRSVTQKEVGDSFSFTLHSSFNITPPPLTLLFLRYKKEIKNDRYWSLTISIDFTDKNLQVTLLESLSQSPENRRHHVGCNRSSLVSVEHVKCFLKHFVMHGVGWLNLTQFEWQIMLIKRAGKTDKRDQCVRRRRRRRTVWMIYAFPDITVSNVKYCLEFCLQTFDRLLYPLGWISNWTHRLR